MPTYGQLKKSSLTKFLLFCKGVRKPSKIARFMHCRSTVFD